MKRWQRRRIALAHDGCRVRAEMADVFGDWAYLKVPDDLKSLFVWDWQVTHVPTGLLLLGDLWDKATARRICRRVAGLTDWAQYADGKPLFPVQMAMRVVIQEEKDTYFDRLVARGNARVRARWRAS